MSRRNMFITGLCLAFGLLFALSLFKLVEIEKEKIETQRRIYFERRASEIRADIEKRIELLNENWQRDRDQVLDEGLKLVGPSDSPKDCANQIAQWIKNVDGNYQSAKVDLIIEERLRMAKLRKEIWVK